jgi:hypothetical protein
MVGSFRWCAITIWLAQGTLGNDGVKNVYNPLLA